MRAIFQTIYFFGLNSLVIFQASKRVRNIIKRMASSFEIEIYSQYLHWLSLNDVHFFFSLYIKLYRVIYHKLINQLKTADSLWVNFEGENVFYILCYILVSG